MLTRQSPAEVVDLVAKRRFEVGRKYQAWSGSYAWDATDSRVWTFTVVERTAKSVTLVEESGEVCRVGVYVGWDGSEFADPFGADSACPAIRAERPVLPPTF